MPAFDSLTGEMSLYSILLLLGGVAIYLFLRPPFKVWLGFFVMTSCFDLVPKVIANKEIWDAGIIMLLLASPQLYLVKKSNPSFSELYVKVLKLFLIWMGFCFIWSIAVYHYPLILTIKESRQMLLGYLSFFILLRIFESDSNALNLFLRSFYILIYLLLIICLAQYLLKIQILSGHYREMGKDARFLPIFLPFAHLFMWQYFVKAVTGGKVGFSGLIFVLLTLFATLNTFTRGIYFAVLLSGSLLGVLLLNQMRLSLFRAFFFLMGGLAVLLLFFTAGALDKFVARASTGLSLISSDSLSERKKMDDTFSGRIALTGERFRMIIDKNPILGFGFIHEDIALKDFKLKFQYGSVVYMPEYLERYKHGAKYALALHSADTGWPDIVIDTGFVGLFLFISFLITIFIHYLKSQKWDFRDESSLRLPFLIVIFYQMILMFDGSTYVNMVQISCFMLAGYTYLSRISAARESAIMKERVINERFTNAQSQYYYPLV